MSALPPRHRIVLQTLLPSIDRADFDAFYEQFAREGDRKLRLSFRLALFVATWVAPLLVLRIPPLSLHRETTRTRILERLFSSRFYLLRQTSLALKLVVSLCYGADPDVRRDLGIWLPGSGLVERLR